MDSNVFLLISFLNLYRECLLHCPIIMLLYFRLNRSTSANKTNLVTFHIKLTVSSKWLTHGQNTVSCRQWEVLLHNKNKGTQRQKETEWEIAIEKECERDRTVNFLQAMWCVCVRERELSHFSVPFRDIRFTDRGLFLSALLIHDSTLKSS